MSVGRRFDPNGTFPFIAIADWFNVPYASVLHYADMIERGVPIASTDFDLIECVRCAVENEARRRMGS